MIRLGSVMVMLILLAVEGIANNVRIKEFKWNNTSVSTTNTVLKMTFNISWDNSWRDDFNYDAVYVFFKFKQKDAVDTPGKEEWHHLYLKNDDGNSVVGTGKTTNDFSFWLSPLSTNDAEHYTGMYIYRNKKGNGNSSVDVTVNWDIAKQLDKTLIASQINNNEVLISAEAIEMVYVPRGAFRIGDGISEKSFGRTLLPILPEFDEVKDSYAITGTGKNVLRAANHVNENVSDTANAWVGVPGVANYWQIDFGEGNEKKIIYFGVNASKYFPTYYPTTFKLSAFATTTSTPTVLWEGTGKDNWVMAPDAYPVERAILVDTTKAKKFRYYRISADKMYAGFPVVNSIAMSETDMTLEVNKTVVIDGETITKDTLRAFGARDGEAWTGTIPKSFPVGYREFFAMKYEISQEQYVRFLNKLTYAQQNQILGNKLAGLQEGDYIFGESNMPSYRNGIIVAYKTENQPVVFANNLNGADPAACEGDGQTLACNYMSVNDMLAYADWACLRPLTEMEYEKMSRRPFPAMPLQGEYAWNTATIVQPGDLGVSGGKATEKPATGNANFGNEPSINGPVRTGAFATTATNREQSGAGFSGVMELSGNVAEIYYNTRTISNRMGITLAYPETSPGSNHGDGRLSATGAYNGYGGNSLNWLTDIRYFAVRGGSWADHASALSVSSREHCYDYLSSGSMRDSTVSFRLGHSLPVQPELVSVLTLENGKTTLVGDVKDAVYRDVRTYTIAGNKPEGMTGAYTYLWYMKENGGLWKLMEDEHGKDLKFTGFRTDTLTGQTYSFKRKVVTGDNDSETSSSKTVTLEMNTNIIQNGPFRCWADGTYARSAYEYRYPKFPYVYSGVTGNGVYRIDPDGAGPIEPYDVYCDMTTDGGGWMLAGKFSNNDAKHWCADKKYWTDKAVFGDVTDITAFEDAKSAAWSVNKVNYMMFQTMKVANKAFVTTDALGDVTLSDFFTAALATFPDVNSTSCYRTLNIKFVNSVYTDFPWMNPVSTANSGFRQKRIAIAKGDGADSQGVISGFDCEQDEADWGLGSLEDCVFDTHENQVDVGAGGNGASDAFNVLLFVK